VYDLENSTVSRHRPSLGCCTKENKTAICELPNLYLADVFSEKLTVADIIPLCFILEMLLPCLQERSINPPVSNQLNPNNGLTPFTLNINYDLIVIFPSTARSRKLSFTFTYCNFE
jgi:hypothetical protein